MAEASRSDKGSVSQHVWLSYGYMALWVFLSGAVILLNKYLLDPKLGGFPYPVTLTATHMLFCSIVSWLIIKAGWVDAPDVPLDTYLSSVMPVGVLFAVTLWVGNTAYLFLSVSFIQMIKAQMPLLVYMVGCGFGVETLRLNTVINMVVVVAGVVVASFGEIQFVLVGFLCQVGSIVSEAIRLTLVQVLLQRKGIKLNPITTMYLVSPVCFAFLLLPLITWEGPELLRSGLSPNPWVMLASVLAAFALNVSVFLLIGKTSALTMNITGVIKDCLLIAASVALLGSVVTPLQLGGYAVALAGVFWYNYQKIQATAQAAARAAVPQELPLAKQEPAPDADQEELPLLKGSNKESPA